MLAHTLFIDALKVYSVPAIAKSIGLHSNTVKRWQDLKSTPDNYLIDLARLLNIQEYGNTDRDKDKFFTKKKIAELCYKEFKTVARNLRVNLDSYNFIEPSAGDGTFYDLLPNNRRIGIDIDPPKTKFSSEFIVKDYLTWKPEIKTNNIVIGNPPFGLRGHLALQFINYSHQFADMVAFILPPLFNSDGKGVPAKRVKGYSLARSIELPTDAFYCPDGRDIEISTIFQVWSKINTDRLPKVSNKRCKEFVRVFSLSDGGTPSSTRNKNMLYKCDIYLPSTCFKGMRSYSNFDELPHRRGYGVVIHQNKDELVKLLNDNNWERSSFRSTNGASNLRTSIIEKIVIRAGYFDE